MVGYVVSDLQFASGVGNTTDCDTVTNWSPTATQDTTTSVQGTASNSIKVNNTITNELFTLSAPQNLTGLTIYGWVQGLKLNQWATQAAGGIGIRVEDASANYREWYTGGSDNLPNAGWLPHVVKTDQTPSAQSATPANLSAITKIGFRFDVIQTSNKINVWWDALRIGTGKIIVAGGTPPSPATLNDITLAEATNAYGIDTVVQGVHFLQGQVQIGSTSTGSGTYFSDTSQIMVFQPSFVPASGFYDISFQGNPQAPTTVLIGRKSGSAGISGFVIKSGGATQYTVHTPLPNIASGFFGLYGTSFTNALDIHFPKNSPSGEILNCNFENDLEIYPSGSTMTNINVINAPTRGLRLELPSFNVTNSNFISNSRAIETPSSGTGAYSFTNLIFTGNTYDISNTSPSGVVTINALGTSNPSTSTNPGGGSVIILTAASLVINIVDSNGNTITDTCEVKVIRNSDGVQLYSDANITTGTTTYSYTSGGGTIVYINVLNKTNYVDNLINNYTLPNSGTTTLTVQLQDDLTYHVVGT